MPIALTAENMDRLDGINNNMQQFAPVGQVVFDRRVVGIQQYFGSQIQNGDLWAANYYSEQDGFTSTGIYIRCLLNGQPQTILLAPGRIEFVEEGD